ncbi:coiled-coil domain-containing protein 158 isoform X2 [Ammospiza nelsoni]|nr:coiled-coil domain-containing protein 158 isoform X2 [Ammospiza nelsoni]
MHPHHICHLESTVCQLYSQLGEVKRICESKVQDLEKQFYLAHSETAEAQTGSTQNSKLRTRVISQTGNTGRGSPMQSVKDEKEARICEMEAKLSKLELEKVQLVSTCTERLQALNDAKLEKDDLLQELWAGPSELAGPAGAAGPRLLLSFCLREAAALCASVPPALCCLATCPAPAQLCPPGIFINFSLKTYRRPQVSAGKFQEDFLVCFLMWWQIFPSRNKGLFLL